jgi:hypothetical protein
VSTLFEDSVREIDAAYKRLGHTLGWRFLSVSKRVLDSPVKVALITLNPAGDSIPPDHPWESCEAGVSYLVERWGGAPPGESKLQIQVREMFKMLGQLIRFDDSHERLMAQSLISHLVPFRSPRFAELPRQEESLDVGRRIWARLLPRVAPRLVICLGRKAQSELRALIPHVLTTQRQNMRTLATGWGDYTVDIEKFAGANGTTRLLYLPHLSTWSLFTSLKCASQIRAIMAEACHDL